MNVLIGKRTGFVVLLAALAAGAALTAALPASAVQPPAAADPAVITEWNAISVNTIAGAAPNGAGLNNAEGIMWFAFTQAAVYNAVEGITGAYDLYDWNARAPKGASPEAAAAVAAHDGRFPGFQDIILVSDGSTVCSLVDMTSRTSPTRQCYAGGVKTARTAVIRTTSVAPASEALRSAASASSAGVEFAGERTLRRLPCARSAASTCRTLWPAHA